MLSLVETLHICRLCSRDAGHLEQQVLLALESFSRVYRSPFRNLRAFECFSRVYSYRSEVSFPESLRIRMLFSSVLVQMKKCLFRNLWALESISRVFLTFHFFPCRYRYRCGIIWKHCSCGDYDSLALKHVPFWASTRLFLKSSSFSSVVEIKALGKDHRDSKFGSGVSKISHAHGDQKRAMAGPARPGSASSE